MVEPFSVGSVLGTGFRVWLRNLVPFVLITAVIYVPIIVWSVWFWGRMHDEREVVYFVFEVIGVSIVLDSFVSAAITFGVVKQLQGQPAPIWRVISTGFSRMLPALGVAVLAIVAMMGGFVLLVVPGFIVYCMFYVATPASGIEKPGIIGALRRSRDLTRGYRGHIFGLRLVLYAISWSVSKAQESLLQPHDYASFRLNMYVSLGVEIALGSLGAVVAAVAYYYLRAQKEGTTASELAKVFE